MRGLIICNKLPLCLNCFKMSLNKVYGSAIIHRSKAYIHNNPGEPVKLMNNLQQ